MRRPVVTARSILERLLMRREDATAKMEQRYGVRFHDPERDLLGGRSYTQADIRSMERAMMPRRRRRR